METKISINMYEKGTDGLIVLFFSKVSVKQYADNRILPFTTINMEIGSSLEPFAAVDKEDAERRVYYEVCRKLNMSTLFGDEVSHDSVMRVATKWRKINLRK